MGHDDEHDITNDLPIQTISHYLITPTFLFLINLFNSCLHVLHLAQYAFANNTYEGEKIHAQLQKD